ncbi:hypothetical protein DL764_010596 [Monosporascus ibericus]|uniref:Fungal N-terminal domain-containing protein n=1 Tax=Monosporascus ibericus TaxID=155417 RepID=A0A4Q4SSF9_9PEZI|nr:hypothetical protein DL764_010596 [Monosporascus ibericus]
MDVAASLASLIQFTITGLNIISKTFSSIKEGPDTVAYVAKHATDLLHILQRLEHSPVVEQSQDIRLGELMKACHADVMRMAQKLADVDFNASDKFRIKLWRSAKSVVKEKEWKEFQTRLHEYSNSLGTFIIVEDRSVALRYLTSYPGCDTAADHEFPSSEKLFDMSRRIDNGYESIHERLMSLSAKCDGIETKCSQIEAIAQNPQLQSIIDSVRRDIQDQLQLFASQHETNCQQVDATSGNQRGRGSKKLPAQSCAAAATYDTSGHLNQLSYLVKNKEDSVQFGSDAASDIVEDIALLVDGVKSLIAEAEAAALKTKAELAQKLGGRQPQSMDQGMVLYREVRFTPDISPGTPLPKWADTETGKAAFQPIPSPPSDLRLLSPPPCQFSLKQRHWSVETVLDNSRSLEAFFSWDNIRPAGMAVKPAVVNRKTLSRLVQWSRAGSGPQTLWLRGWYMPERGTENPLTRIGLKLVDHAARAGIPMVSYFCQLGRLTRLRPNEPPEAEALTSVLYAFIRQTLRLLPPQFEGNVDLSEERFRRLDGTEASWNVSLAILNDVIRLAAQSVFCILDGVQWLEHSSTDKYLRTFLDALRHDRMNVLFVTTGTSLTLRDAIPREETLADEELRMGSHKEHLERHGQDFWQ